MTIPPLLFFACCLVAFLGLVVALVALARGNMAHAHLMGRTCSHSCQIEDLERGHALTRDQIADMGKLVLAIRACVDGQEGVVPPAGVLRCDEKIEDLKHVSHKHADRLQAIHRAIEDIREGLTKGGAPGVMGFLEPIRPAGARFPKAERQYEPDPRAKPVDLVRKAEETERYLRQQGRLGSLSGRVDTREPF